MPMSPSSTGTSSFIMGWRVRSWGSRPTGCMCNLPIKKKVKVTSILPQLKHEDEIG